MTTQKMVRYSIKRVISWEASHILTGLPPVHPCSRMHGHSYRATIEASSFNLDEVGMVLDFNLIKEMEKKLDHRHLNEVIQNNPTAENIAYFILQALNAMLLQFDANDDVTIDSVWVQETERGGAGVKVIEIKLPDKIDQVA